MASLRQKTTMAEGLGMFLLEQGKILTVDEYRKLGQVPFRWSAIRKVFSNWNRALHYIEKGLPDLWAELQNMGKAPAIDLSAIEEDYAE